MGVDPNLTATEYANCERCGVVCLFVRGAAHRCAGCSETLASIDAVLRDAPELPMMDEQIATRMRATRVDPNWATTYVDPELAAILMGLQAVSEPAYPNALSERDAALARAEVMEKERDTIYKNYRNAVIEIKTLRERLARRDAPLVRATRRW